jgi:hypothetical protein
MNGPRWTFRRFDHAFVIERESFVIVPSMPRAMVRCKDESAAR